MLIPSWFLVVGCVWALLNTALVVWLLVRRPPVDDSLAGEVRAGSERLERELRDELGRSAQGTRQELGSTLANFQQTLTGAQASVARLQNEQIDSFRVQLAAMQQAVSDALQAAASSQATQSAASRDAVEQRLSALQQGNEQKLEQMRSTVDDKLRTTQQTVSDALQSAASSQAAQSVATRDAQDSSLKRFADTLNEQLRALSDANERRMTEVRGAVEQRLTALQQGNEQKLEQMRATVDEKLHATLEQRLGESFKQVADRLEQVHRGLGEMQGLARDVGSLTRVLSNVKTRGTFGETQLAGLLEQVFTPEQYGKNVETVPASGARVEFAIRLPGQRADGVPLWLPIDAKFPREDYERLIDAQHNADAAGAEAAAKAIETRLRAEAKTIREKYVSPPHTTDFGILFVPTEGLYAEALRRPGLVEALQREHRVMLAGPTTLLATLTSLQMGFRTLALEKRSVEVWEVLGAVKTEFGKFGEVLAKTKKKLDEASNQILSAERRARVMSRELRSVEALPDDKARLILPMAAGEADDDEAVGDLFER